jgi:hypothetical protein
VQLVDEGATNDLRYGEAVGRLLGLDQNISHSRQR